MTEKQEKWLCEHFKNTKNDELATKLSISLTTLHRYARTRGLTKTRQFRSKCQAEAAKKAYIVKLANNSFPPKGYIIPGSEIHRFKKGVTPLQRCGKKKNELRISKIRESRLATIRKERARLAFGLPQKTKIKLTKQDNMRLKLRWYLKHRGYRLDEERRLAIYDENTHRCPRLEVKGNPYYQYISAENAVNYATNKGQNVNRVIVNEWGSDFFEIVN